MEVTGLTTAQAAALAGLTVRQIGAATVNNSGGPFPALRASRAVNGQIRITRDDLADYLRRRRPTRERP